MLTRIVGWWSLFTILTGTMSGFVPLLNVRFLFGAGEAGALPTAASIVVARWFPPAQRATMSGVNLMASQVGGAIAPLLMLRIQMRHGWRMSFYVFGVVGLVSAAVLYSWFRDSPAEKQRQTPAANTVPHLNSHAFPWRAAARSQTVWAVLGLAGVGEHWPRRWLLGTRQSDGCVDSHVVDAQAKRRLASIHLAPPKRQVRQVHTRRRTRRCQRRFGSSIRPTLWNGDFGRCRRELRTVA